MTDALSALGGIFHRRFLFNALLPTLVFASVTAGLIVAEVASLSRLSSWWTSLDAVSKVVTVGCYFAAIWFLSAAVASQWRGIVRIFEGYPTLRWPGRSTPGRAWHDRKRRLLFSDQDAQDFDRGYYRYPFLLDAEQDDELVLPTTLGNILLAGERYAERQYGIESIYLWPRLYPLLPAQFQADYEEFTLNCEFPLVVAFLAMITAVVGGAAILFAGGSGVLFISWFGGGALLAYVFYVLSFSSAEELAEQQRTAFDLYRHLLLEQWPTPLDVRDERDAFKIISQFIVEPTDLDWGRAQTLHRRRQGGRLRGAQSGGR